MNSSLFHKHQRAHKNVYLFFYSRHREIFQTQSKFLYAVLKQLIGAFTIIIATPKIKPPKNNGIVMFSLLLHKDKGHAYLRLLKFKRQQVISNGCLMQSHLLFRGIFACRKITFTKKANFTSKWNYFTYFICEQKTMFYSLIGRMSVRF